MVQNVSLVNTVLATITANAFKEFSDAIEAGAKPREVAEKALKHSFKVCKFILMVFALSLYGRLFSMVMATIMRFKRH